MIRRYEHAAPGDLVHIDVKKLGRIPDGGGWHAHRRADANRDRRTKTGFDYVHPTVDHHTRLAYSETHADAKVATCAGFLTRAAAFFAGHGIERIERVLTDNHHRCHTALGGQPPITRANNPAGQYSRPPCLGGSGSGFPAQCLVM